jgi:electron transport complex protein RnfC
MSKKKKRGSTYAAKRTPEQAAAQLEALQSAYSDKAEPPAAKQKEEQKPSSAQEKPAAPPAKKAAGNSGTANKAQTPPPAKAPKKEEKPVQSAKSSKKEEKPAQAKASAAPAKSPAASAKPSAPAAPAEEMPQYDLTFPSFPFRTHGGVNAPHRKNTENCETEILPIPEKVVIPMKQHIGAACTPTVKVGDIVSVGEIIGNSDAAMSAPIHASVSGKVSYIGEIQLPSGERVATVEIKSDGEQRMYDQLTPPKVENIDDLIKAVRTAGLVGLGGAGFPAAIKLQTGSKPVDTLIINGSECEPYITSDFREMVERPEVIMEGVYLLLRLLGVKRVIIGVEGNKPKAIEILSAIADNEERDPENKVRILKLKSQYPQGAEKVLIQACTGRVVPKDKLPVDVGCIVMNITSVAFVASYIKTGIPLVNKRVTVDGSAVLTPKNILAPIGTPIADLLAFCDGYREPPRKLIWGGPMMGFTLYDTATPIIKQTNGVTALTSKDVDETEESACIRCGRCVDACPMNLMPVSIEVGVKTENAPSLASLGTKTCMECGCCAYSCPAKRPLVQYIRMGKDIIRKNGLW